MLGLFGVHLSTRRAEKKRKNDYFRATLAHILDCQMQGQDPQEHDIERQAMADHAGSVVQVPRG